MKTLTLLTTATLLAFSIPAYAAHGDHAPVSETQSVQVVHVRVNGLVCDFCARALEKVFGNQEEVSDIDVDLDKKVVTIRFKPNQTLDDEIITKLILDSGYNVEGIHRDQ